MKSLRLGNAGWVRYQDADCPPLFLRYLPDERGRWLLRELYVDASAGESPIARSTLAAMPLPDIEANVNRRAADMQARLELRSALGNRGESNMAVLASYFATTFGKDQPENWVWVAWSDKTPVRPQRLPRGRDDAPDPEYRLPAGPVNGLTGEFLESVAAAYWAATARGESPNIAIHEQVPHYELSTVRWWVRVARQRGFLPAGRRGVRG